METTDTSLTINRVFPITIEDMWDLWTNPARISQWHRPNMTDFSTQSSVDAVVGGKYRIEMTEGGETHTAMGEFKEIDKPHKLSYSWQWENDPSNEVSEVTVSLVSVPEGTKLTLVHARLSGPQSVKDHGEGWLGCLENINVLLKGGL